MVRAAAGLIALAIPAQQPDRGAAFLEELVIESAVMPLPHLAWIHASWPSCRVLRQAIEGGLIHSGVPFVDLDTVPIRLLPVGTHRVGNRRDGVVTHGRPPPPAPSLGCPARLRKWVQESPPAAGRVWVPGTVSASPGSFLRVCGPASAPVRGRSPSSAARASPLPPRCVFSAPGQSFSVPCPASIARAGSAPPPARPR